MDGAEIYGKVIRCTLAKPNTIKAEPGKAIWSSEDWIKNSLGEGLETQNNDETSVEA